MSKHFELLQQIGQDQSVFMDQTAVAVEPAQIKRPQSHLEGLQAEEVSKLVQRVFLLSPAQTNRMVVFTTPEPGNGCSWICRHASELLASQIDGSVCLVDANLASPGLHERFGMKNHFGLTDSLQQVGPIRKFASPINGTNLWLLSSGAEVSNWQNLLCSDRGRQRLHELHNEFDHVLIDAPPLSHSSVARMLCSNADGAVLVLKANSSRREVARRAMVDLKAANVILLGAVLNQRTFPIPSQIYNRL
jgi:Mrp family chromosome partitioning ATPase